MSAYDGNEYHLFAEIPDIAQDGTAAAAGAVFIPVPHGGKLVEVRSVVNIPLVTADAVITVTVVPFAGGAEAIAGTVTIDQATAVAGTVTTWVPSVILAKDSLFTIGEGGYILLESDGGPDTTAPVGGFTVTIER